MSAPLKSVGGSCASLHVRAFGIFDSPFESEAGMADRMSSVHKAMSERCDRSTSSDGSHRHCLSPMMFLVNHGTCLLYTSPSPRDKRGSRMPSSA